MRALFVFVSLILVTTVAIEIPSESLLGRCFKKAEYTSNVSGVYGSTISEQWRTLGIGLQRCLLSFANHTRTTPHELHSVGYNAITGLCLMFKAVPANDSHGLSPNTLRTRSFTGFVYYEPKSADCLSKVVATLRQPADVDCASDEWQCKNGQCIKKDYHQDQMMLDCDDCSDEDETLWDTKCPPRSSIASAEAQTTPSKRMGDLGNSSCTADQWQCKNGQCIKKDYHQDQMMLDCDDCSDEDETLWDTKCPPKSSIASPEAQTTPSKRMGDLGNSSCTADQWQCKNGQCIKKDYHQDQMMLDCDDCSDEDETLWDTKCPPKSSIASPEAQTTPSKRMGDLGNSSCTADQWQCKNGQCIKKDYHQDQMMLDCDDCSDEDETLWDTKCPPRSSIASAEAQTTPSKRIGDLGNSSCTADEWQCKNGQCIKAEHHQDKRYLDCNDCSDEDENMWDNKCPNRSSTTSETRTTISRPITHFANLYCPRGYWKCKNGQCIRSEHHQDGHNLDCTDCSDENESVWDRRRCPSKSPTTSKSEIIWHPRNTFHGTKCTANQWQCKNGQCIPKDNHRDGTYLDCDDCSDEDESLWRGTCPPPKYPPGMSDAQTNWYPRNNFYDTKCTADQWQCKNGQCIEMMFYKDGLLDCEDCSDENEARWDSKCPSGNKQTAPLASVSLRSHRFGSVCNVDEWQCKNGWQCIKKEHYDDGYLHCNDCSDEHPNIWDGSCLPPVLSTQRVVHVPKEASFAETFSNWVTAPFACLCVCLILLGFGLAFLVRKN